MLLRAESLLGVDIKCADAWLSGLGSKQIHQDVIDRGASALRNFRQGTDLGGVREALGILEVDCPPWILGASDIAQFTYTAQWAVAVKRKRSVSDPIIPIEGIGSVGNFSFVDKESDSISG